MAGPIPPQAAPQSAPPAEAQNAKGAGGGAQQLVAETHDGLSALVQAAAKASPQAAEFFQAALSALEQGVDALTAGGPKAPQGPATPEAGVANARPAL